MLIGYARVSTDEQETRMQIDALKAAGAERIFEEKASGAKTDRPELARMLDIARDGDVIIVWKLDRLGRSLIHLIATVNMLNERGVQIRSLTQTLFDTTTPSGKLMFGFFALLAEFERDQIIERTKAGQAAARKRGAIMGPKPKMTPDKLRRAKTLLASGDYSMKDAAVDLGVHKTTLYRALLKDQATGGQNECRP